MSKKKRNETRKKKRQPYSQNETVVELLIIIIIISSYSEQNGNRMSKRFSFKFEQGSHFYLAKEKKTSFHHFYSIPFVVMDIWMETTPNKTTTKK